MPICDRIPRNICLLGLFMITAAASACSKSKEKEQSNYLKESREAEAIVSLQTIYRAQKIYFEAEGKIIAGSAPTTPALAPCVDGKPVPRNPDPALWDKSPWKELLFEVRDPYYYSYRYEGDVSAMTAVAEGDIDCDGQLEEHVLTAVIEGGKLVPKQTPKRFKTN